MDFSKCVWYAESPERALQTRLKSYLPDGPGKKLWPIENAKFKQNLPKILAKYQAPRNA